jgi:multidrug efflux system outer membrane protein
LSERIAAGVVLGSDLEQAKTALATTKGDLTDVVRQRSETLHALGVLCGTNASTFHLAEQPLAGAPVVVPAELPSTLLERRPDIARAERNLMARNAQIGVARAAYFPSIHLTGQGGFLSKEAGNLLTGDSRVWSIAPGIRIPLFTAGRISADVRRAEAAYEEALAEYRQSVLVALREVEDSLAQIALRNQQAQAQGEAIASARHVIALAKARYDAGTVNFLEVADAERNALQQERRQAQLQGQRFAASVRLIKALGGGW